MRDFLPSPIFVTLTVLEVLFPIDNFTSRKILGLQMGKYPV
jgi:hypothetical protein